MNDINEKLPRDLIEWIKTPRTEKPFDWKRVWGIAGLVVLVLGISANTGGLIHGFTELLAIIGIGFWSAACLYFALGGHKSN